MLGSAIAIFLAVAAIVLYSQISPIEDRPLQSSQQETETALPAEASTTANPIPTVQGSPVAAMPTSTPSATTTPLPTYQPTTTPESFGTPDVSQSNQIIVRFTADSTAAERDAYLAELGSRVVESIDALDTVVIEVPQTLTEDTIPESPILLTHEPDSYLVALETQHQMTPNDPRFSEQWALPVINAPVGWDSLLSDPQIITVAVVDSGICAEHPDLAGRVVAGYDFIEDDDTPQDPLGHGCAVAGIIAANINDGIGIAGVAPNAQIMPLRALNAQGYGTASDIAAAIVYATDGGADIINLILGSSVPKAIIESAVEYAVSKDVLLVAAVGNTGQQGVWYPAAYDNVIGVGSVDPNLQQSTFSTRGIQVDVLAPGRDILTLNVASEYSVKSGTSFAAPHVAGIIALELGMGWEIVIDEEILSFGKNEGIVSGETTPNPSETLPVTPQPSFDTYPNISESLLRLYSEWADNNTAVIENLAEVSEVNGRQTISIIIYSNNYEISTELVGFAASNGGRLYLFEDDSFSEEVSFVLSGTVPFDILLEIAEVPGVLLIDILLQPSAPGLDAAPQTQTGFYNTFQAPEAMGVPAWHSDGSRGEGVTIAVVDVDFAQYDEFVAAGEAPTPLIFEPQHRWLQVRSYENNSFVGSVCKVS